MVKDVYTSVTLENHFEDVKGVSRAVSAGIAEARE